MRSTDRAVARVSSSTMTLIEEWQAAAYRYTDYAGRLETLVENLIRASGFTFHSVSSRVKSRESLERKLGKAGASYERLSDITDLVGIRIITYLSEDVDKIGALVRREFTVDDVNSIDKRAALEADKFGYLSLHYVVVLGPSRAALTEYEAFAGLKAEIQIRSILQHAWAEIEHDLGYKSTIEIPREVRRHFARLAGLLELADDEFSRIKKRIDEYRSAVGSAIQSAPSDVELNGPSLEEFLRSSPLVRELDEAIVSEFNKVVDVDIVLPVADDLQRLQRLGLVTVADLESALNDNRAVMLYVAKQFANDAKRPDYPFKDGRFARGVALTYVQYALLGRRRDVDSVRRFFEERQQGDEAWRDSFSKQIVALVERALGRPS